MSSSGGWIERILYKKYANSSFDKLSENENSSLALEIFCLRFYGT